MIDTHAHLQMPDFREDRADVIDNADQAGIAYIVVVGFDIGSSIDAISMAEKNQSQQGQSVHPAWRFQTLRLPPYHLPAIIPELPGSGRPSKPGQQRRRPKKTGFATGIFASYYRSSKHKRRRFCSELLDGASSLAIID